MFYGTAEGTRIEVIDPRFNDCLIGHARIERLWSGARWLEGPVWFAAGRYLDRFARRDGVWKIAHRLAVYDWTMTVPASGGWDAEPMLGLLRRGERGTGDPSYAHLAGG